MNQTMKDLLPHRAEFARALRNFNFERTDDGGIFLPQQKLTIKGVFSHTLNGRDERIDPNLVVNEGINDILAVAFASQTADTGFFVSLFINNVSPVSTLTAAQYPGTMGEFTNYTQGVRPTWAAVASTQSIGNDASPASFTFGTGGGSVWGAALHGGDSAKSSTDGHLIAATKFALQRSNIIAGDLLAVQYDIVGSSS